MDQFTRRLNLPRSPLHVYWEGMVAITNFEVTCTRKSYEVFTVV